MAHPPITVPCLHPIIHKRNPLRLKRHGLCNHIIPRAEHIAIRRQLENAQQSVHRFIVTFQPLVSQNMLNRNAPLRQIVSHQQSAMTFQRFLFATHPGASDEFDGKNGE